jgi:phenylacetate-CoA ligase
MTIATKIYSRTPAKLRSAPISLQGIVNYLLRYGPDYRSFLRFSAATEYWPEQSQEFYQLHELLALVQLAKSTTRHYNRSLPEVNSLSAGSLRQALDELPLLNKEDLRADVPSFVSDALTTASIASTSGSTGSPLSVPYDRNSIQRSHALISRIRQWIGAPPRTRVVRLTGRVVQDPAHKSPPYWVMNYPERMLLISTYHLSSQTVGDVVTRIEKFDPVLIEGYPSAIREVSTGLDSSLLPNLLGCITTAETLDAETRNAISLSLGRPTIDYYSFSEGGAVISQCLAGTYHVMPASGIVEVVGSDGAAVPVGQLGEIVVTSFRQFKTPLIRYRSGDFAVAGGWRVCTCGRGTLTVAQILGRDEDVVITRDGRRIGMFSYRTIKHLGGIRASQIVQESPHFFRVMVVPDPSFQLNVFEGRLRSVFAETLGYQAEVRVEIVERVALGPSGKLRSTIRRFETR